MGAGTSAKSQARIALAPKLPAVAMPPRGSPSGAGGWGPPDRRPLTEASPPPRSGARLASAARHRVPAGAPAARPPRSCPRRSAGTGAAEPGHGAGRPGDTYP